MSKSVTITFRVPEELDSAITYYINTTRVQTHSASYNRSKFLRQIVEDYMARNPVLPGHHVPDTPEPFYAPTVEEERLENPVPAMTPEEVEAFVDAL